MPAPGTDIWMACNAYTFRSATGALKGATAGFQGGEILGEEAEISEILTATVTGTLKGKKLEIANAAVASFFSVNRPPEIIEPVPADRGIELERTIEEKKAAQRQKCESTSNRILGYKARPLTGIWATAPYLHNGSVPTLYDLLLPEGDRPRSFYTGTREFDPVKAGYVTAQGPDNTFLFETHDSNGRPIDGNSNSGHDYGNASFSDEDRRALVEYLKTL
jgi:hypothetical protein